MKALVIYNSSDAGGLAGAAMAKLKYSDCTLKDINGVETGAITSWIVGLSAVYNLVLYNCTITTAGTGVLSEAQVVLLDAKIKRTVAKTSTTTSASSGTTVLTDSSMAATANEYAGMYVKITAGTGIGLIRRIVSNTTTALTLDSKWSLGSGDTYVICANREDFGYAISGTSGNKKRAIFAWEHEKLFAGILEPLIIYKLGGDKTTATSAVNAQDVLDEGYMTVAAKYFLRDLTSQSVVDNWNKLLSNNMKIKEGAIRTYQDVLLYRELYKYGKLLKESKTAFSES